MKITVNINGDNKTEVLEKANEFIADGYLVVSICDEQDGTGTVKLEQEDNGDEENEEKEDNRFGFNSGELVD